MGERSLSFRLSKTKSLLMDDSPLENIFSPINPLEQHPPHQVFNSKEEKSDKSKKKNKIKIKSYNIFSLRNIFLPTPLLLPKGTKHIQHFQIMSKNTAPTNYSNLPSSTRNTE
jgi:hypothetical protein